LSSDHYDCKPSPAQVFFGSPALPQPQRNIVALAGITTPAVQDFVEKKSHVLAEMAF